MMMAAATTGRLRAPTLVCYALPAFAFAMPTIPVYVYLPSLYAQEYGLGLATTGLVLLLARGLDVVTDPPIGIASDRFATRFGRRKPWILAGAALAGVALVQLFQPPGDAGALHLLVWVIVLNVGWTMVAIPYNAWGAELSADYHERSRITGGREGMMILGVLAAGALPAIAATMDQSEGEGLAAVAWLAVAVGAPTVLLLAIAVPDSRPKSRPAGVWCDRDAAGMGGWRWHATVLRNRPFLRLLTGWFVNGLANGLPAVLFPLYLQHVLEATPVERGIMIMTYFLAGVLAIPLWVRLSRRFGKHRIWCAAMLLACASFIWVPLLEPRAIESFFVICMLTGMSFGADLVLPPAMQADVVDLDTLRTRENRAGWYFALWSMSTKLALAAAVGIAFPLLGALGFQTEGDNEASVLLALALTYALLPTLLKLAAIAVIWGHPITAHRQGVIRRRLAARMHRGSR